VLIIADYTIKFDFAGSTHFSWPKNGTSREKIKEFVKKIRIDQKSEIYGECVWKKDSWKIFKNENKNNITFYFGGPTALNTVGFLKNFFANIFGDTIRDLPEVNVIKAELGKFIEKKLENILTESFRNIKENSTVEVILKGHSRGGILSVYFLKLLKAKGIIEKLFRTVNYKSILLDPVPGGRNSSGGTSVAGVGDSFLNDDLEEDRTDIKKIYVYSLFGRNNLGNFGFTPYNNFKFDPKKDICILQLDEHEAMMSRTEKIDGKQKKINYKGKDNIRRLKLRELLDNHDPGIYYADSSRKLHSIKGVSYLFDKCEEDFENNKSKIKETGISIKQISDIIKNLKTGNYSNRLTAIFKQIGWQKR
jgi:hypothetical protein